MCTAELPEFYILTNSDIKAGEKIKATKSDLFNMEVNYHGSNPSFVNLAGRALNRTIQLHRTYSLMPSNTSKQL